MVRLDRSVGARRGLCAFVVAVALLFSLPAAAAPVFPALSGRVVDAANVIPQATEAALTADLAALETSTGTQLVVATIPALNDVPIEDYGYQLGRAWGIGQKGKNSGAILIVAPNDRKVRIEVGYGLEPVLTDALSSTIIQTAILPKFRENDIPAGIVAGTAAIVAQLSAPPEEAAAAAADAAARRERASSGGAGSGAPGPGALFFLAVVVLFLVFAVARPGRGRRRRYGGGGSGIAEAVLWGVASSMLNRGGGSGGFGGGGGGGFSGGGGSFGGGGSSGSW